MQGNTDNRDGSALTAELGLAPELSRLEISHNAGFVEASRIHGREIERLRGLLDDAQAQIRRQADLIASTAPSDKSGIPEKPAVMEAFFFDAYMPDEVVAWLSAHPPKIVKYA